ncbi:phosphoglycerol transferase MdoB-like AlkP superfamily enzyme [Orbus hercynius]|uniref:Phosphoglycerol transferase MdoB-like AlkP superfamily enzyme n=1 Tax=Orbus hercynius TaxID=593135 RepID=A0A495RER4_9GAMM|nr:alkaline phosphatase family protein [Orbus hercynius]RKS85899.1 phosphoglycerol transferase MdoB-like AlkP superfamily enzyme [Orbus hercynius]
MWFIRFKQAMAILFMPWLLSLIVQSLGRLFLLFTYVSQHKILEYQNDVIELLTIGLRFDIRIANIAFGTLLILSLFTLFSAKVTAFWQKILSYLATCCLLLITVFTVINIFYYITYDRHIDVFIFGLIDDDTVAVLKTIWSDYPVIWGGFALILLTYVLFKFTTFWRCLITKRINHTTSSSIAIPCAIVVLIMLFIGCRGGVSTFPLREANGQISRYAMLNQFVPNGVIAMNWAYTAYQLEDQLVHLSPVQREQAMKAFFGEDKPDSVNIFMSETDQNPIAEAKLPNVVFSVMESMGSHLFQFDSANRDLLGTLRPHWQNDWLFSRFVSEGDGTIDSLNRFFVRSPMDKISQSIAQDAQFISNMFKPFKDNGYKIIYITAGNGAWRNLNQFLPKLGVDEFIEQNTLQHEFPDAELSTWGVPDEYMFKYAEKRLAQAEKNGEHVMIMMMSVTNHPPYHLPAGNPYFNYTFTPQELQRFKNMDSEIELRNMFNTFRYSNEQLGNFINWVKSQPLADHTILAATGDHNLRRIGYPDPQDLVLSHAVPFYLYVPKAYQYNSVYDKRRIGSHKDIMPTLYQLSLSQTPYYQTGCNLLATTLNPLWCNVGYNPYVTIDQYGAYALTNNTFLPWQDTEGLAVSDGQHELTPAQQAVLSRWQSWTKLLQWQLTKQIESH